MSDEPTLPPIAKAESALKKLITWSAAHVVVSAFILGAATGWLLPKILKWVL